MPPTPPTPRVIMSIGDVMIAVQSDPLVVTWSQWIYVTHRPAGLALADFLVSDWRLTPDAQWIVFPHDADVDFRLRKLAGLCGALRRVAPRLVQLVLPVDQVPPAPVD